MFQRVHNRGLTIAELLVATGLLGVVLVTVMTLFGQLLFNTDKNSMLSAGSFFADAVLDQQIKIAQERLSGSPDNGDLAFDPAVIEGESTIATTDVKLPSKYIYRLEAEAVALGDSNDYGQMWYVEVEVRWWNDSMEGDAARANMGRLSIKRGRMVYLTGPR